MDRASYAAESRSELQEVRASLHKIWKEIDIVREKIRVLTLEIENANTQIKELRIFEQELLRVAASTAPSLSPFQRLPPETIGEIVGQSLAVYNGSSLSHRISNASEGIWPLTHVCQSWRSIILSTPQFWSSFWMADYPHPELVSTVLERSRNLPLSLTLTFTNPHQMSATMSLLVDCSERWKSLDLVGCITPTPLLGLYRRLPLLEYLRLQFLEGSNSATDRWVGSEEERRIFEVAPRLASLVFQTIGSFQASMLHFPTHQLSKVVYTNLQLTSNPTWQVGDFANFSDLVDLDIMDRGTPFPATDVARVLLPTLRHLCIESPLCHAFRVPHLESLTLIDASGDPHGAVLDIADVHAFLDTIRAGTLSTFHFTAPYFLDSHLISVFSHSTLQSVRELTLVTRYWERIKPLTNHPKSFLTRLTFPRTLRTRSNLPTLLLNLRSFTYEFEQRHEAEGILSIARNFVISRTRLSSVPALDAAVEGNQFVPVKLEEVCIKYDQNLRPITLHNFHLFEAGLVQLVRPVVEPDNYATSASYISHSDT